FDPAGCKKYTTHGPVRNVVEWIERGWLAGLVLEPSVIDGKETPGEKVVVRWDVLLEGGHLDKMCTALDWKPADGFVPRGMKISRKEWEEDIQELWGDDPNYVAYLRRMT